MTTVLGLSLEEPPLRIHVIIFIAGCCGLTLLCVMCRDTYLSWAKRKTANDWKQEEHFKGPRWHIMPIRFRAKRIRETKKRRRKEQRRASRVGVKISDGRKRPTAAEYAEMKRREAMPSTFVKVRRVMVEEAEFEVYGWEDLDSSLSRECHASVRRVCRGDEEEIIPLMTRWEEIELEEDRPLEVVLASFGVWSKDGGRYGGAWGRNQHGNVREGFGVQHYKDGSRYAGQWQGDLQHGEGILEYSDGSVYIGIWREGKRHGDGVLSFGQGGRFEGQWRDDAASNGITVGGGDRGWRIAFDDAGREGAEAMDDSEGYASSDEDGEESGDLDPASPSSSTCGCWTVQIRRATSLINKSLNKRSRPRVGAEGGGYL